MSWKPLFALRLSLLAFSKRQQPASSEVMISKSEWRTAVFE